MAKILIMVRTSTEVQSISDQHNEMEAFVLSKGWKKDQIIWVEEQGASAAKVDDAYRAMIDKVKSLIEQDKEIKCFAVWHLNRLARTEEVWVEVKTFFVSHKVQVLVKNPELRLLTEDGKVDPGMELAAGLLALLAKQDQEERVAKFKRAKSAMLKQGKYTGGNVLKFGYKVEEGTFVMDEEQGPIVQMIYDLYSTGDYSTYSLSKELEERGIRISDRKIAKILQSVAYIGDEVSETGMHYPPIISRGLYEACAKVRAGNKIEMKRGEKLTLCAKLVKCPVCGATCTSNSRHYKCCKSTRSGSCANTFGLNQKVADSLAWRVAYPLHLDYLMDLDEKKKEEYGKELEIVEEKIAAARKKMDEFVQKKDRILDTYMEGLIDKNTRDLRLKKLQDEVSVQSDNLSSLEAKKRAIMGMLEEGEKDAFETFLASYEKMEVENKYEVIHRHIESIVAEKVIFGKRDRRTKGCNAVRISIKDVYGHEHLFMYCPRYYKGSNLYIWNGKTWVADYV